MRFGACPFTSVRGDAGRLDDTVPFKLKPERVDSTSELGRFVVGDWARAGVVRPLV
jgi:hypothetical protein